MALLLWSPIARCDRNGDTVDRAGGGAVEDGGKAVGTRLWRGGSFGREGASVLEFCILGPVEVLDEGRELALGGPRQRAVLAVLLLRRGEVVSSDRLIDLLWGERPPATAAKTLQGYVSHLRKALGDGVLLTRRGGYLLAVEAGQLDAQQFAALVADAESALAAGDAARARQLLGEADALWRGQPLADLSYEQFAQGEIARLEEARLAALEDRFEADLMLGRHRSVVGELEAMVDAHPHRERLLVKLMLALYRSGRHAEALEAYRRGRQALSDDLGLEPGPALRALEQQILNHDPLLDAPRPPASARLVAGQARSARGRTLTAAGGALLAAAAIAAVIVRLGGAANVRVAPNSLAVIDTHSNAITAAVPVGTRPGAVIYGSGSLWVANQDDQTVSRVDPRALRTLRTIPVGDPPTGIVAAAGRIWVAVGSEPVLDHRLGQPHRPAVQSHRAGGADRQRTAGRAGNGRGGG